MKIKASIKLILSTVLILPLLLGTPVFAQEHMDGHEPTSNQMDMGSTKSREQRIKERKDKLTQRLTQVQQNVVKTRCAAANGLIKSGQARLNTFVAARTKVYSGLVERLEALSPKLQAAGVDTTKYDEQVGTLKTKAGEYSTAVESLKQAVDDLANMDCAADPEGFVATLQEAARLRQDVITKGQDFRTYVKDTLKPTFTSIRAELQTARTEGEQ